MTAPTVRSSGSSILPNSPSPPAFPIAHFFFQWLHSWDWQQEFVHRSVLHVFIQLTPQPPACGSSGCRLSGQLHMHAARDPQTAGTEFGAAFLPLGRLVFLLPTAGSFCLQAAFTRDFGR